jgi:hypothetical protein
VSLRALFPGENETEVQSWYSGGMNGDVPTQLEMGLRPRKKGLSGCVIALLILAACGCVVVLGTVIVLWHVSRTPTGQRVAKIAIDTASIMYRAQSAPGAKEVRKAGNCDQAFVISGDEMAKITKDVSDADARHVPTLVTCQVGVFWSPPTCELIAETYVAAVHPTGRFMVNVKKVGAIDNVCQTAFEADGTPSSR